METMEKSSIAEKRWIRGKEFYVLPQRGCPVLFVFPEEGSNFILMTIMCLVGNAEALMNAGFPRQHPQRTDRLPAKMKDLSAVVFKDG